MRHTMNHNRAFTLPELGMAIVIGSVVVLIGWTMMVFTWRQVYLNRVQTAAQVTAFNVVQMIEEDVMRSNLIQTPDTNYPSVPSMRVRFPAGDWRAYRLVNGDLTVQYTNAAGAPAAAYTAFSGITSLAFAPVTITNVTAGSVVRTTCTMTAANATIQVTSTAFKRNN